MTKKVQNGIPKPMEGFFLLIEKVRELDLDHLIAELDKCQGSHPSGLCQFCKARDICPQIHDALTDLQELIEQTNVKIKV